MAGEKGAFVPDPSWPSMLELASKLWGEPTLWSANKNEVRFGSNQSKSIRVKEMVWKDHKSGEAGGYIGLWKMVHPGQQWPPPRTDAKPNPNGHAAPSGQHKGPPPWEDIATTYPYHTADGTLFLEVVRTISRKPRFRQRRPNGTLWNGEIKWAWKVSDLPGHDCILYRLPELLASGDATVFVVEGEKDADTLAALGFTATTNIGGAGKWRAEYGPGFQGRDVVVLPDNDATGISHADDVARSVAHVAASIKVLKLPGLAPKGDVSDWLANGGTRASLEWLVEAQAPWTDPVPITPPPFPQDVPFEDEPEEEDEEPPDEWDADTGPGGGPPGPEPPPIEEVLQGEGLITEQYAARLFTEGNKDKLRYNHSSNLWMLWDQHRWRPDERKLAFYWSMDLCRQLAATIEGSKAREGRIVVEKIRFSGAVEQGARVMPEIATAQNDWDSDPWLLGTPGGVVDLTTAEMRPGLRSDMISKTTSVTPSEQPECPKFMAFLRFAMHDDEEMVKFIQRYLGYCLTGKVNEEIFLFLFGPAGAGKGTLIETVTHIMGDYAGTVPMEVFTGKTWSPTEYYRADMAGKRMIVANEPERDAYWAEAFIKETTGGDTLSARHPMGRPFKFKPTHKLALVGNHMPKLRGRSTGMERRLNVLPCDRKPETPDTGLKAALLAEGPGILRFMIEGCIAWQKVGMKPPEKVKLAGNKYFEGQDCFARWVEEDCILGPGLETTPADLRKSYNQWAKSNGEDEMTGNAFSEALDQYEVPKGEVPLKRGRDNTKRWVRGIGLKPQENKRPWWETSP